MCGWALPLQRQSVVCICRRRFRAPFAVRLPLPSSLARSLARYSDLPAAVAAAASASSRCPRRQRRRQRRRWRGSLKTVCSGKREGGREGGQRCGNRVILLPLEQGEGERERGGGEGRGERAVHDCCKKSHVNNLNVSFLLRLTVTLQSRVEKSIGSSNIISWPTVQAQQNYAIHSFHCKETPLWKSLGAANSTTSLAAGRRFE